MTYEAICEKLGFDPLKDGLPCEISDHEDDSKESPFAVLSYDELSFLADYVFENRERF